MANVVGYEELTITAVRAVGPTTATIRGALCAIFLVDPKSKGIVRWQAPDTPAGGHGFPLYPGKWISIAGANNVRDSKFILDSASDVSSSRLYCLYFDRVDVVAADFAPPASVNTLDEVVASLDALRDLLNKALHLLTEQKEILEEL